jgi:hypothetical protein
MTITTTRIRGHRTSRAGCRTGRSVEHSVRRRSREPVTVEGGRVFFSGRIAQHMKIHRYVDWVAAVAMLLAAVSWSLLVSLLAN